MITILLVISMFIMVLCISLHFNQHFRCRSLKEEAILRQHRSFDRDTINRKAFNKRHLITSRCIDPQICQFNWCCAASNEEYDFFPTAFLLYMISMLILSSLILFRYILTAYVSYEHAYNMNTSISFSAKSNLRLSTSPDWIIYILIFIAMIWESLFSFYRYYTTMISSKYFYSPKLKQVLKPFSIYIVIFVILFTIQTQIYYWLFPAVFLCYFVMNVWWNYKVAHTVLQSFYKLTDIDSETNPEFGNMHRELMHHVKVMRNLSILSVAVSSIYILAFVIIYNMSIIYYFPIIWCFSMSCFAFNFVRNRNYISSKFKLITCHKSNKPDQELPVTIDLSFVTKVKDKEGVAAEDIDTCTEKSFVVCIEHVHVEKSKPVKEKQIKTYNHSTIPGNIVSHSDELILKYNKLNITDTNPCPSRSAGDLMSLPKKKRKNNNVTLMKNDITTALKKIQVDQIKMEPSNQPLIAQNTLTYVTPKTPTNSPTYDGLVILNNTPVANNNDKNSYSKTELTFSDNVSQSHLELDIFDGSTFDTNTSVDFSSHHTTTTSILGLKKPMSALILPYNNLKNTIIRSASNPLLSNIKNIQQSPEFDASTIYISVEKKKGNALKIPTPVLETTNSVPILHNLSVQNIKSKRKRARSGDTVQSGKGKENISKKKGKLRGFKNRKSRHESETNDNRKIQQQKLLIIDRTSAVSMLNLFIAQGFYDKKSVTAINSQRSVLSVLK